MVGSNYELIDEILDNALKLSKYNKHNIASYKKKRKKLKKMKHDYDNGKFQKYMKDSGYDEL